MPRARPFDGIPGGRQIVRSPACRDLPPALNRFYTHHYRADYKKTYAPKAQHIYRAGLAAAARLRFLHEHGIDTGTLLDIGAGGGEFVFLSRAKGYEASGVEPNIGYSEFAENQYGVEVMTGDFE